MRKIHKVCVVGAGLMGKQIALNAALHGYLVMLNDSIPEAVGKAETWADEYLKGRVAKGKLTEEAAAQAKKNLFFTIDLEMAARDADLVIEAIIEEQSAKEALFRKLNELAPKDAILATNSSFMVSSLFAGCVDNPARLANLH